ncbi:hypothetical protein MA16_Dca022316 [Dendrobium catenatum]|uniref:Uncharacterized protein n=1 Tax=Dendrobium catenatum TaxID=906689 RepID=A0A2I0XAB0_9ASPA|nr:hypothetical protein MA16_Dca022316 [Dendrobium catenatum]
MLLMVADVRRPPVAGVPLHGRRSSSRATISLECLYSSSPLAFGDEKSVFSQMSKSKMKSNRYRLIDPNSKELVIGTIMNVDEDCNILDLKKEGLISKLMKAGNCESGDLGDYVKVPSIPVHYVGFSLDLFCLSDSCELPFSYCYFFVGFPCCALSQVPGKGKDVVEELFRQKKEIHYFQVGYGIAEENRGVGASSSAGRKLNSYKDFFSKSLPSSPVNHEILSEFLIIGNIEDAINVDVDLSLKKEKVFVPKSGIPNLELLGKVADEQDKDNKEIIIPRTGADVTCLEECPAVEVQMVEEMEQGIISGDSTAVEILNKFDVLSGLEESNDISYEKICQRDLVLYRHLESEQPKGSLLTLGECEQPNCSLPTLGECERMKGSLPTLGECERIKGSLPTLRVCERTDSSLPTLGECKRMTVLCCTGFSGVIRAIPPANSDEISQGGPGQWKPSIQWWKSVGVKTSGLKGGRRCDFERDTGSFHWRSLERVKRSIWELEGRACEVEGALGNDFERFRMLLAV